MINGDQPDPSVADPSVADVSSAWPSPLAAVADMRAAAKWILAAAAAVGAVLLGGGPLTAAGKVHGPGGAALAYAGLVIGLAGVGWAIWHTADALIPPLTTPRSLETEPALGELRDKVANDKEAFFGPFGASMSDLARELAFHRTVAGNLADALAAEQDPVRQKVLADKLGDARATVAAIRRRSIALAELVHAWQVRARLRRARLHAFAGAAVAAAGAVLFLAATSTATAAPVPVQSPVPAVTGSASG
jgi:hypothetical protein